MSKNHTKLSTIVRESFEIWLKWQKKSSIFKYKHEKVHFPSILQYFLYRVATLYLSEVAKMHFKSPTMAWESFENCLSEMVKIHFKIYPPWLEKKLKTIYLKWLKCSLNQPPSVLKFPIKLKVDMKMYINTFRCLNETKEYKLISKKK